MFLNDAALENAILRKLDYMIDWTVTKTVQVKSMEQLGAIVKVVFQDINTSGERAKLYTMSVPV